MEWTLYILGGKLTIRLGFAYDSTHSLEARKTANAIDKFFKDNFKEQPSVKQIRGV